MHTATKGSKVDISSEKKLKEFAINFSSKLKKGDIYLLFGEIGVGKTTFIRYLINWLQKKNNLELTEVTSPTFNILNEYYINQTQVNHYDLFRLKSYEDLKNLNLFDENSNIITLIEWPQIIKKKPKNLIELNFNYEDDHQKRSVIIKGLNLKF